MHLCNPVSFSWSPHEDLSRRFLSVGPYFHHGSVDEPGRRPSPTQDRSAGLSCRLERRITGFDNGVLDSAGQPLVIFKVSEASRREMGCDRHEFSVVDEVVQLTLAVRPGQHPDVRQNVEFEFGSCKRCPAG